MELPEKEKLEVAQVATQAEEKNLGVSPDGLDATPEEKEGMGKVRTFFVSMGIESYFEKLFLGIILAVVFAVALFSFYMIPPADFPSGKMITIKKDTLFGATALKFEKDNLVRSQNLLKLCVAIHGGDKKIGAGDYIFKEPIGTCALASRLVKGVSGIPVFRATITEGMSNQHIAKLLAPNLVKFNSIHFVDNAAPNEGYLFPDTYFFATNATAKIVETTMRANFDKKIIPLKQIIESSGRSERDIIIMASILEKEAKTPEDFSIVSGILWKRIKIGMPLQVDATFMYLLGKKSSDLTLADLAMKSAYNTYKNKGLPAGPIGNPGLIAIEAAVKPKDSLYFYYLSDKNDIIHYARTFEEHKANKVKYLR